MTTCGFVSWESDGRPGRVKAACECGWASHAVWKHKSEELKAVQKLREHVMRGWA